MKFVKIAEIKNSYKALRDAGISKEDAPKALEKNYSKKGYTGSFVLKEDGEEIGMAELEFKEMEEEEGEEEGMNKGFTAIHAKAIADQITKGMDASLKKLAPAVPIDREDESRAGFKHAGEFLVAIKSLAHGTQDNRLAKWREKSAPSVAMGESTGEAGGVLVPPAFLSTILQYQNLNAVNLLSLVNNIPMSGNSITIPTNEETPWGGGTQAYWQSELDIINQNRPSMKNITLTLNDLTVLVPVGNNLLEDSAAASTVVAQKIGQALEWKQNEAIINGGGAGMPQGILNSGALVTVAKETGQAANTITLNNLVAMYTRLLTKSRGVWFVTPQGHEQIMKMVQPGGLLPSAFNAIEGFGKAPLPTIYGLPIVTLENCSALGQKGDVILADLNAYVAGSKNVKMATSIHLFFDTNATAFRAVARMDGKTWATKSVVSAHDANFKRSSFVTLAPRQ